MNKTYYICKYTPIELIQAFGGKCENLNTMQQDFHCADEIAHSNICGFGKAVLEAVMNGNVRELVLVNCCDTIRSVYDVLYDSGKLNFLYFLDILHHDGSCSIEWVSKQLQQFSKAYGEYKGTTFDEEVFFNSFESRQMSQEPYVSILGARMGKELFGMVQKSVPYMVRNDTCVNNRSVGLDNKPENYSFESLMNWYAAALLKQIPCMRMPDHTARKALFNQPNLKGIIYHTVKFCDFYSFEYAMLKNKTSLPLLKIESDYTIQSSGQLKTRLDAFSESLIPERKMEKKQMKKGYKGYFAGIDSGSTSTDVVIINKEKEILAEIIMPTGAGAAASAERTLEKALKAAALKKSDIDAFVTTGYGREAIRAGDKTITEISCHAKGAHFLDPTVRTVIDIGGQDSKVICLDENGKVINFVMNDKCAAGTGRFLEMMARTMEMELDKMSTIGLSYTEDITISSMCTVFAESEVVSLIAENKAVNDIVHGINKAVASKTVSLVKRAGGAERFMMTGGVSKNEGLVKTLEEQLGAKLVVHEKAQLCGALGAALFAMEMSSSLSCAATLS